MNLIEKIKNMGIASTCNKETHYGIKINGIIYCSLEDERYICNDRSYTPELIVNDKLKECEYKYRCQNGMD